MLWMKLKLKGAPKRNRSGRCSEVWEYQKQNCKGTCANFLVSHGPFGSATKKKGFQDFLGQKRLLRKVPGRPRLLKKTVVIESRLN